MKIEKNKSGVYVARIDTAHGKRTVNLQTRDASDARKIAKDTSLAEVELIARTGKVRKEVLAQVVLGRKIRAPDAITEYESWMQTRRSDKQVSNVLLMLRQFLREMKLEGEFVHALTENQVDKWINDPKSEAKATTRNIKLSAIRGFFDFCSIRNYAIENPAREVRVNMRTLRHEQKEAKVGQPFTEQEFNFIVAGYEQEATTLQSELTSLETYLAAAVASHRHPDALQQRIQKVQAQLSRNLFWRCAVQTSWHTGLRLGDICQLEWASLATPMRLIVWTEKTNARIELRLRPSLATLLKSVPKKDDTLVFPEEAGTYGQVNRRSNFSVEFSRFLDKLEIPNRSFHGLRHAFSSRAAQMGMPLDHIRQRLGHTSEEMTKRYVH